MLRAEKPDRKEVRPDIHGVPVMRIRRRAILIADSSPARPASIVVLLGDEVWRREQDRPDLATVVEVIRELITLWEMSEERQLASTVELVDEDVPFSW